MKILMVTRGVVPISPGCGGSERFAYQLSRYLARSGHDVTLVSDVDGPLDTLHERLRVLPVNSLLYRLVLKFDSGFVRWIVQHLVGNLTVSRRVRRLLKRESFDLIHTHGSLSTVLIARRSAVPVVYTEQDASPWQCRYRRWWERLARKAIYWGINGAAFRSADLVAATFPELREEIMRRWKLPPHRVCSAPNSADLDVFNPTSTRRRREIMTDGSERPSRSPQERRRFRFDRYCLYAGRLTPRKGPDLLIRALAEADGVSCVFAGDGPMRQQLERLARSVGVANRVSFLGNVEPVNLARLYAEAELLVLPSVSEASPLAVHEALAVGTPVLASRIAGVPAMVEDWQTGFLVTPGSVGELAVALRFLMRDEDLRSTMAENARRKAMELSGWPNAIGNYLDAYEKLVPWSEPLATPDGVVPSPKPAAPLETELVVS